MYRGLFPWKKRSRWCDEIDTLSDWTRLEFMYSNLFRLWITLRVPPVRRDEVSQCAPGSEQRGHKGSSCTPKIQSQFHRWGLQWCESSPCLSSFPSHLPLNNVTFLSPLRTKWRWVYITGFESLYRIDWRFVWPFIPHSVFKHKSSFPNSKIMIFLLSFFLMTLY